MSIKRLLDYSCDSIVNDAAGRAWALYERLRFYTRAGVSNLRLRRDIEELRGRQLLQHRLLVAYGAQSKIAAILGVSHRTVDRACRVLEAVGWIHPVPLRNNHRAYLLGWREGKREHYYADVWLDGVVAKLPDNLRRVWTKEDLAARRDLIALAMQEVIDERDQTIAKLISKDLRSRPRLCQKS